MVSTMKKLALEPGDALLIVDLQNDFLPGGALGVRHAQGLVARVNDYIERFRRAGLAIIASRDWHPEDHCSFREQGGPWPVHCVAGSKGAAFAEDLALPDDILIVSKSTEKSREAYSALDGTGLDVELNRRRIERIFVCGLATEYCVLYTTRDATAAGYEVVILTDAIGAIEARPGDSERAVEEMRRLGAKTATREALAE